METICGSDRRIISVPEVLTLQERWLAMIEKSQQHYVAIDMSGIRYAIGAFFASLHAAVAYARDFGKGLVVRGFEPELRGDYLRFCRRYDVAPVVLP